MRRTIQIVSSSLKMALMELWKNKLPPPSSLTLPFRPRMTGRLFALATESITRSGGKHILPFFSVQPASVRIWMLSLCVQIKPTSLMIRSVASCMAFTSSSDKNFNGSIYSPLRDRRWSFYLDKTCEVLETSQVWF